MGCDVTITYVLTSPFLGERYEHRLSLEEFESIRRSYIFLDEYMSFEETVLQLIYSYQEFERYILESALDYHIFPSVDFDYFQDIRVKSNIRVMSFLNSLTSLRDQFPSFRRVKNLADLRSAFRKKWDSQKATSTEFAFCERLRNFAQHQTQPVSSVQTGGGWDEKRTLYEARTSIFVDVEAVCENRKISPGEKQVYLNYFGPKADAALLFRVAIDTLGKLSKETREECITEFSRSVDVLKEYITIASGYVETFISCEAMSMDSDKITEKFPIFDDFVKRANVLRRIHLNVNNERHFISNRSRGHSSSCRP